MFVFRAAGVPESGSIQKLNACAQHACANIARQRGVYFRFPEMLVIRKSRLHLFGKGLHLLGGAAVGHGQVIARVPGCARGQQL